MLQIHIGGTKRSGKTTLALGMFQRLSVCGLKPVILDVDTVRRGIFGDDDERAKIGSPVNVRMHGCAMHTIFRVMIPTILTAGGTPITVATHSRRMNYLEARAIALRNRATLRYLLLDTPERDEVIRRKKADVASLSDSTDLIGDAAQLEAYRESCERFDTAYRDFTEPHLRIPQGDPAQMLDAAVQYIFS